MRVSTLYETGTDTNQYFEMCLSTCEENIIDGYYKYKVSLNGEKIILEIIWVISSGPKLLKYINKSWETPSYNIKKTGEYIYNTVTSQ